MYDGKGVRIDRAVLSSAALRVLSRRAIFVLLQFLARRQMSQIRRKGEKVWIMKNSDEIQFTYREAEAKFGIGSAAFRDAIDQLVEVGFLDIARAGSGLHREATKYRVNVGPGANERWRDFGKPGFEVVRRHKDRRKPRFQRRRPAS